MKKLGIIAGAGELPVLLARAAVAHERQPVIIQITKSDAQRLLGSQMNFTLMALVRFKRLPGRFWIQA